MHQTSFTGTSYPAQTSYTTGTTYPSATTYPAATNYQSTTTYPSATTTYPSATTTYPAATQYPGVSTYPGTIANTSTTTSYNPGTTISHGNNYYTPQGQSVAGGRIYTPAHADYVAPGTQLRGGMYTIYDSHAVPTFEAPIVFSTTGHNESRPLITRDEIRPDMHLVGRGDSSHISSHPKVPKKTNKKKGCCAC